MASANKTCFALGRHLVQAAVLLTSLLMLPLASAGLLHAHAAASDSRSATALPCGARRLGDVPYGPAVAQRMDVYLPPLTAPAGPYPALLLVHGGAWAFGDKANAGVIDNKLARWLPRGLVVVSINYRLLPEADPLQQAADVARALAFAQKQAPSWGADPARFILIGHSAGAHLVALVSAAQPLAREAAPWLGSIALDSAGFDITDMMQKPHLPLYDRAFGKDESYWQAASPVRQLSAAMPPLLAVCSQRRRQSCPRNHAFAARAAALGVRVEVLEQDRSHGQINTQLGEESAYTAAVETFMGSLERELASRLQGQ